MAEEKKFVLVVDDVLQNLQVIGTALMDAGYEISMATNGQQCLEMLETIYPDLILLDIMMPEMNGYEVCKKIKSNDVLKEIPIIFLTAKTETKDILEAFEAGGSDYVTKPFNQAELLARVNTHITLRKSKDLLLMINNRMKDIMQNYQTTLDVIEADLLLKIRSIKSKLESLIEQQYQEKKFHDDYTELMDLVSSVENSLKQLIEIN